MIIETSIPFHGTAFLCLPLRKLDRCDTVVWDEDGWLVLIRGQESMSTYCGTGRSFW